MTSLTRCHGRVKNNFKKFSLLVILFLSFILVFSNASATYVGQDDPWQGNWWGDWWDNDNFNFWHYDSDCSNSWFFFKFFWYKDCDNNDDDDSDDQDDDSDDQDEDDKKNHNDLIIRSINFPDGEVVQAGDELFVLVSVKNEGDYKFRDIVVEAILMDIGATIESDEFDLKGDHVASLLLRFAIPF